MIAATVLMAAGTFAASAEGFFVVLILIGGPVTFFINRFSLVLPDAAIGGAMTFIESWRLTSGQTWRLIALTAVIACPFMLVQDLMSIIRDGFHATGNMMWLFLVSLVNLPIEILGVYALVSIWSWAYRQLVQGLPIELPGE